MHSHMQSLPWANYAYALCHSHNYFQILTPAPKSMQRKCRSPLLFPFVLAGDIINEIYPGDGLLPTTIMIRRNGNPPLGTVLIPVNHFPWNAADDIGIFEEKNHK